MESMVVVLKQNMGGKKLESNSNTFNGNKGTSGGGAFHFEDETNVDITIFESFFMNTREQQMKTMMLKHLVLQI